MPRSLRVRREFIEKAKLAVKRSGFPSQRALAEDVGMALATVGNFLTGKPVDRATFVELCEKLSLDVESIATFDGADGDGSGQESPQTITESQSLTQTPLSLPTHPPIHPVLEPVERSTLPPHQDWGEAVDVSTFYGRTDEIGTLEHWIVGDPEGISGAARCRLVMLIGMGGIGKTALSVKVAEQVQKQFDRVVWRSLRNAPPIGELLTDIIGFLSNQRETTMPESLDGKISRLMAYLREFRCLLILDNMESILVSDDRAGSYREGYEGYGQLLRCVGETRHESCLILTSREKPRGLSAKEGKNLPIRSLRLPGLERQVAQEIFSEKGFAVLDEDLQQLVEHYAGNPLALKIVATTIEELFDGNAAEFLKQGTVIFGDISDLLEQQFSRLTVLEQDIMYWLAINREGVSLAELQQDIVPTVGQRSLLESVESLQFRSLIEKQASSFTQQPVVMEYVTSRLIEQVCNEIKIIGSGQATLPSLFNSHALIKAETKDYLRNTQIRLILQPIAERLLVAYGTLERVEHCLKRVLLWLHSISTVDQEPPVPPTGYAAGNLLNLLRQLQIMPTGYDFSNLTIWQAYLQGMNLQRVNFTGADLSRSVFTQTLGGFLSANFSPDGTLLATGMDSEICLWQTADSRPVTVLKGHSGWVQAVVFSPNGQMLASGCNDQTVRLWNPQTGQCWKTLRGHSSWVQTVAFSPDSKLIASGSNDQTIRVWDVATGQCLAALQGHTSRLLAIAFLNEQTLVSSSEDQTIRLWNVKTGQCIQTIESHTNWVLSFALSPDAETLVTGSDRQTVKFWNLETGESTEPLKGYSSQAWAIAYSPDGKTLATGSEDQTIKIWDVETGKCLNTLQEHQHRVWLVAFNPDGRSLLSISEDQMVKFWDTKTGQCLRSLEAYSNWIVSVAFSPDGKTLASSSQDQCIRLWEIETGKCFHTMHGHTNLVSTVAFAPQRDVALLASGSDDQTIKLWDGNTGECINTFWGHEGWVQSVCFSPDGKMLASGSGDRTVKLWDVQTGECLHTLQGHTHRVKSVAFSPIQGVIASGSDDQTIRIWNSQTGECLQILEGHQDWVVSVVFSADGRLLVSGSGDRTVRLWDVETAQCLRTFKGHTHRVRSVAFSSDGHIIASGSDDQTVRLWNTQTGQLLCTLQGHQKATWSVAFSPDSQILASASSDETIRIWDVTVQDCLQVLRAERPYEAMNIKRVKGLTAVQQATLKALGAIELE